MNKNILICSIILAYFVNSYKRIPQLLINKSQELSLVFGSFLTLENGGIVNLAPFMDNTDNQTLTLAGSNLTLEDGGTVNLSAFMDNTDNQELSLVFGSFLTLENGGTVNLAPFKDNTDNQALILTGNDLILEDGGTVNLSSFMDNTDNQTLTFTASTGLLEIRDGNNITITDTDATNELGSYTDATTGTKHKIGEYKNNSTATAIEVNESVTKLTQNTATGKITFTNEAGAEATAETVSTDTANNIAVGTDGGAFYESPIKAFGKVSSSGTALKIKGATVRLINTGDYQVTFTSPMKDSHYIIQLTTTILGGSGYDDPAVSYYDQTETGFKVETGDNDNGSFDRNDRNLEFMFTILDY